MSYVHNLTANNGTAVYTTISQLVLVCTEIWHTILAQADGTDMYITIVQDGTTMNTTRHNKMVQSDFY